ncbi:hypothetical protein RFI_30229 [Reticulomyxa filosa]|uniref:Phosphonoacetaldehyde hydrolase n=1 Tax=Reticulomyxa filosa TaxID=46433 RepID=X6M2F5_RETFI|nr:hypothetical protein RFI_30229 [Reticulomyxa filosa]|eukprot:ETO07160.1 hypothetical protein RFI_30229 [Reticulomyxa filosa]
MFAEYIFPDGIIDIHISIEKRTKEKQKSKHKLLFFKKIKMLHSQICKSNLLVKNMVKNVHKLVNNRHFSQKGSRTLANGLVVTEMTPRVSRLDLPSAQVKTANRTTFTGPLKCAILDWSGTTADAHVIAPAVAFVEVFEKYGVKISMKEARIPMGLRKDLHIAKILEMPEVRKRWIEKHKSEPNEDTVKQLFEDFIPMQLKVLPKCSQLLPGVADIVKRMKTVHNMKIGVTTGFTKVMVDILLREAKKQAFEPDSSVAGDQVINNLGFRPAPFMIYQNLLNLGVFPIHSVVKVDDTVSGVGEGLNAGCWSVGVFGWSNYTDVDSMEQWNAMSQEEKLKRKLKSKEKLIHESRAHYIVEDLTDMEFVITDINQRLKRGETPQSNLVGYFLSLNERIAYTIVPINLNLTFFLSWKPFFFTASFLLKKAKSLSFSSHTFAICYLFYLPQTLPVMMLMPQQLAGSLVSLASLQPLYLQVCLLNKKCCFFFSFFKKKNKIKL